MLLIAVASVAFAQLDDNSTYVAGTIATRYRAILQEGVQLRSRDTRVKPIDNAAKLAGKLSALIEEAATLDYALLNDQDFCALSEVAERLKNPRAALNYACLGFQRSASVKAGIALVRCYCAADDLAAAEQVAMKTTAANVNDEKAYIVHDILAHYCRKTGQLEKACAHMERTISLIMQHADKGVFYVDHLQACLDKFKDLVTATDMSADATLSMNTWRAKAVSQRDEALIRVAVGPRGELLPTDADLSAMRLHTQV